MNLPMPLSNKKINLKGKKINSGIQDSTSRMKSKKV